MDGKDYPSEHPAIASAWQEQLRKIPGHFLRVVAKHAAAKRSQDQYTVPFARQKCQDALNASVHCISGDALHDLALLEYGKVHGWHRHDRGVVRLREERTVLVAKDGDCGRVHHVVRVESPVSFEAVGVVHAGESAETRV